MTQITKFPQALDTENELPNINPDDRMNEVPHDAQHTLLNQAVVQLQKKVGADNSDDESSIDFRLTNLEEHGGGGAGLNVGYPDSVAGGELDLPAKASLWFEVTVNGKKYAVPGFEIKNVEAMEQVEIDLAFLQPTGPIRPQPHLGRALLPANMFFIRDLWS